MDGSDGQAVGSATFPGSCQRSRQEVVGSTIHSLLVLYSTVFADDGTEKERAARGECRSVYHPSIAVPHRAPMKHPP